MASTHLPAARHLISTVEKRTRRFARDRGRSPGAGFDTLNWQVGSTEIGADCPFSDLAGLDRQFMVIDGAGVELVCTDEAGRTTNNRIDQLYEPFAFRGDWRTTCRLLAGPVRVFNVVTRRGWCSAKVEIVANLDAVHKTSGEALIAVEFATLDAWLLDRPIPNVGRAALVKIMSHPR